MEVYKQERQKEDARAQEELNKKILEIEEKKKYFAKFKLF